MTRLQMARRGMTEACSLMLRSRSKRGTLGGPETGCGKRVEHLRKRSISKRISKSTTVHIVGDARMPDHSAQCGKHFAHASSQRLQGL